VQREFLARLHCPYSASPLLLSVVIKEEGGAITYGIVSSEAGDFPIVEGILRLHIDEYREPIVQHVRETRFAEALTIALDDGPFHGRSGTAINFASRLAFRTGFNSTGVRLNRLKRNFTRAVTAGNLTFMEIAAKLSPGESADWQICRFSMPTFLPVFALLHVVKEDRSILDFGCGTGQASFLISRMWPDINIVCADYSFCSLYLAKKYFVPEASYVCLDGNYLLPFESGEFSTVFSSDTLHCIDSKLSLVQEFRRVGFEKAFIILPHLHNRLASPYAKSLTPNGYRELFRGMQTRIVPEQQVIRDYFFNDTLDLCKEWSDEELAPSEQGLSIVASADSSAFTRRKGLWDQRIRSIRFPCINPAYRITGRSGDWQLTRQASDRYGKTFTQLNKTCLPESYKMATHSVDATSLVELQRTDPAQFVELARSLLVLDLPDRFMVESQLLQNGHDQLSVRPAV